MVGAMPVHGTRNRPLPPSGLELNRSQKLPCDLIPVLLYHVQEEILPTYDMVRVMFTFVSKTGLLTSDELETPKHSYDPAPGLL
jgi:hypothetical protein